MTTKKMCVCAGCTCTLLVNPSTQWRAEKRAQNIEIENSEGKFYGAAEMSSALHISYDVAQNLLEKLGATNLGTSPRRYKRGKRKLRDSGRSILQYLRRAVQSSV